MHVNFDMVLDRAVSNLVIFVSIDFEIVYSKSPRIRTYFFESQAEISSYFKDTNTNFKV